jgi:hypothetical protein
MAFDVIVLSQLVECRRYGGRTCVLVERRKLVRRNGTAAREERGLKQLR